MLWHSLVIFVVAFCFTVDAEDIQDLVEKLPGCSLQCYNSDVPQVCNGLNDYACQCSPSGAGELQRIIQPCIQGSCGTDEISDFQSITSKICSEFTKDGGGGEAGDDRPTPAPAPVDPTPPAANPTSPAAAPTSADNAPSRQGSNGAPSSNPPENTSNNATPVAQAPTSRSPEPTSNNANPAPQAPSSAPRESRPVTPITRVVTKTEGAAPGATAQAAQGQSSSDDSGLPTVSIALISVGIVISVFLIIGFVWFFCMRPKRKQDKDDGEAIGDMSSNEDGDQEPKEEIAEMSQDNYLREAEADMVFPTEMKGDIPEPVVRYELESSPITPASMQGRAEHQETEYDIMTPLSPFQERPDVKR